MDLLILKCVIDWIWEFGYTVRDRDCQFGVILIDYTMDYGKHTLSVVYMDGVLCGYGALSRSRWCIELCDPAAYDKLRDRLAAEFVSYDDQCRPC